MAEAVIFRGTLEGHGGWVTQVVTNPRYPDMLISASRDKTIILWSLTRKEGQYGFPSRRLRGHSHFVSDVVISSCGQFAVSSSWDKTLRLWDLDRAQCSTTFQGHQADVLSVAFSADNRQIISAGRDKSIKLWNTLGELKWSQEKSKDSHTEWVSCVKFSPTSLNPVIVSAGWDKVVKVWHLSNFQLKSNFIKHSGAINSLAISPDGSLAASGGTDGKAILWDLGGGEHNPLHELECDEEIHHLCFSPNRYWLTAACNEGIVIWDLESKTLIHKLSVEAAANTADSKTSTIAKCISLCWSTDGQTLFAGYTDNAIRVFEVQIQV